MSVLVMGILNVTPDSFSDGGQFMNRDVARAHALAMVEAGADVIDIGGVSSRPGAVAMSEQEELDRVMPVWEAIRTVSDIPLSIDTTSVAVMRAALAQGAWMVNDITALQSPGAMAVVQATACQICLMHMQGTPATMQIAPTYPEGVVPVVQAFFEERLAACEVAGIEKSRIWLDPGIGFGKTQQHNLSLLKSLSTFATQGAGLMIGVSRKSVLGAIVNQPVAQRLHAGVAAACFAVLQGVRLIRTHDVRPTKEALLTLAAIQA